MKTTFLLSKIYLKELLGSILEKSSYAPSQGKKKRGFGKKILLILLPLLLYPQLFLISYYLYSTFIDLGMQQTAISVTFLITSFLSFLTIFSSVISNLGGDKSLSQLISLPLKARQIFSARMLLFYFITVLETVYILLPTAIFYAMDFGWHTLPIVLLVGAFVPLIPICVALLLIMPFAKLFAKSRLKKIIPYILNIGFFILYMGFMGSVSNRNLVGSNLPEIFQNLVNEIYPPAAWGGGVVQGNLTDLLYFVAVNALVAAISYFVSGYFSSVVLDEHGSSEKQGKAVLQSRSVMYRLIARQWGIMFSSHRFVLQCLGSLFTTPLLIVFYLYADIFDFDSMYRMIHQLDMGAVAIFIAVFSPSITSAISISGVAREGRTFWENKVLPIGEKRQVLSRFYFGMLLNLPVGVVTGFLAAFTFKISWFETLIGMGAGIGYIAWINSMDHLLDFRFPNLDWTNEMQAVKNSKAIAIGVLAKILFSVAVGGGIYFASGQFGMMATLWGVLVLGMILGILGFTLLMSKGVELYRKIDA